MTAPPVGPPGPTAAAIVSVAFCPCPPVLLPAVEGRPAAETDALRRACTEAVVAMLASEPDAVVVVGDGAEPGVRYGRGAVGHLSGFGVDLAIPFDGPSGPGVTGVPLAHMVGAWLLDEARFTGPRVGVGPGSVVEVLAGLSGTVGILAMGDGSARRTLKAPGYLDEAAESFDRLVARALSSGDADALAALDVAEGRRLLAAGSATWQAVGAALAGRPVLARLRYDDAPFGVGYLVADWARA